MTPDEVVRALKRSRETGTPGEYATYLGRGSDGNGDPTVTVQYQFGERQVCAVSDVLWDRIQGGLVPLGASLLVFKQAYPPMAMFARAKG